jgi:dTDP-4-amino-4,6-dideoxygalactose transaminase
VIWEKGTNRRALKLGQVDKYSWVDYGSSFLPSELTAAVLFAQFEGIEGFNAKRCAIWEHYHASFADLEAAELIRRPSVPSHCVHNGHLYYLLLEDTATRDSLIARLQADEIWAPFHYIPLHSAEAGRRYARAHGSLHVTDSVSSRLLRLPMHADMSLASADRVIERVHAHLRR